MMIVFDHKIHHTNNLASSFLKPDKSNRGTTLALLVAPLTTFLVHSNIISMIILSFSRENVYFCQVFDGKNFGKWDQPKVIKFGWF